MNNSDFKVVLQRVGDESPITLGDEKCLIRTVLKNQRVDCCAIINGPNGTAIRSYRSGVLVNGEPTSVRQLSSGDVIELPCETKIEVQQATQIRPVISKVDRSIEDVDRQLARIQSDLETAEEGSPGSSYLAPPVNGTEDETEEKFLSPFSPDLPEINSESFGQPVASTASPENQLTADDALQGSPAGEVAQEEQPSSVDDQDLESIFAKLGVTSVGSISNPVSGDAAAEAAPVEAAVAEEVVVEAAVVEAAVAEEAPVEASSVELPVQLDDAKAIRQQLEAATNQTSEASEDVSEQIVPTRLEASTIPMPAPVAVPAPVAEEPQRDSVDSAQTVEPGESEQDPLSELPSDLRDQLNDLVSSLKTGAEETASLSSGITSTVQPTPTVPTPVEPSISQPGVAVAATAAAATAAAAVAATLSTKPANENPDSQTIPQPIAEPTPAIASSVAVPTEAIPTPATPPAPVSVPQPEKNRSVADVLGSMGVEIPGDDDVVETEQTTTQQHQPDTPAPAVVQPVQEVPTSPVFANMQNADSESQASETSEGNAEKDIQAYMNRLLNRDESAAPSQQQASPAIPVIGSPINQTTEQKPQEVVPVLSEEEFVPTHKASRPENYDTLREIANDSSRNAIEQSNQKSNSGSLALKATVCILSLIGAGLMFWFQLNVPAFLFMAIAIVSLILCALDGSTDSSPSAITSN